MNVERLQTLISYMRRLPKSAEKHFDMMWWYTGSRKGMCPVITDKKQIMKCGTTACALGWAATSPKLKAQGLIVVPYKSDGDAPGITNTDLGKAFFELDDDDFDVIFGADNMDETPKDWADRVEEYLVSQGHIQ